MFPAFPCLFTACPCLSLHVHFFPCMLTACSRPFPAFPCMFTALQRCTKHSCTILRNRCPSPGRPSGLDPATSRSIHPAGQLTVRRDRKRLRPRFSAAFSRPSAAWHSSFHFLSLRSHQREGFNHRHLRVPARLPPGSALPPLPHSSGPPFASSSPPFPSTCATARPLPFLYFSLPSTVLSSYFAAFPCVVTASSLQFRAVLGHLVRANTYSTLPPGFVGESFCAAIKVIRCLCTAVSLTSQLPLHCCSLTAAFFLVKVSADGQYLYGSNRAAEPARSSVVVCRILQVTHRCLSVNVRRLSAAFP